MESYRFDVVVAGGGVNGVCAAITAARAGWKTVLIQNRPVLGGNSSSEIRVWTRGSVGGGTLYAEEMGVLGELKLHNMHINPDFNPVLWDEVLLDKVLAEPNLTLYLNTNVTDVQMQSPERINSIIANQQGTELQLKISGRVFIDATGDGTVGYFSNAPYREGRESRSEFGESLGMAKQDSCREGSTIMFQSKDAGKPVRFAKPDYAYDIPYIEKLLNQGGRVINERLNGCDYWWVEYGGTKDTIRDNQEIAIELKRLVMGIWNYIKNSGRFNTSNQTLEWVGNIPGKRESRRFIGKYTLTQNDLERNTAFPDAVCSGGWFMDFHPEQGIYAQEAFCTQIPVFSYQIPLRCFYNESLLNLLFSGRNISTSHAAFSSTRIQDTCGLTGQAAAEIAACCAAHDCSPAVAYEKYRSEIQQNLLKNDMNIWDLKNSDPEDLALQASVSCSGTRRPESAKADGVLPLRGDAFLAIPHPQDMEYADLEMECEENTVLEYSIYASRLVSRKVNGEPAGRFRLSLTKDQPFFRLRLKNAPANRYLKIVFTDNPHVRIKTTGQSLTGFLAGQKDSPFYRTPCLSTDSSLLYHCRNVVNGYSRPQNGTNLWISGPLEAEQWLKLTWKKEQRISGALLYLNPDLSMEIPSSITNIASPHHGFARRSGAPGELVKAFSVYAEIGGRWKEIAAVDDNYQRLCRVAFDPVNTAQLKIVFRETYGSPYAEVFEVRVY